MVEKRLIRPRGLRKIPKHFSWVDHRLVRERYIDRCSHQAAALYLFLVTVADAQGLSYYSEKTLTQRLNMEEHILARARLELIDIGLVAYQKPLYQVLALDTPTKTSHEYPGELQSLAQIFKHIGEEAL
jgi:replication initiation and membrane attachment protein DnaB